LKAARLSRILLLLAGILLVSVLVTNTLNTLLAQVTPVASAAERQSASDRQPCTGSGHSPSFGSTVTVARNEVFCGDITTVGGSVVVEGELRGNILAFGSVITIDGGVNGNIKVFGGSVAFQSGSSLHGNVDLYGSKISQGSGFHPDGTIIDHSKQGWFTGFTAFSFPAWFLFLMIPLGFLYTWLLPEHVMFVRTTVRNEVRRSLLIGLLSALLAPVVLVVLIALIISIPIALLVLLVLLIAWTAGIVAISWILGERIIRAFTSHPHTRYLQVVVGVLALALLGSLPFIGWLISLGTSIVGLGAVLLSRFGTRLHSQPKQPLPIEIRL